MHRIRTKAPVVLACVASLAAGMFMANAMRPKSAHADDDKAAHGKPVVSTKAPIQELLHCPLSFAGVHLLKDLPEQSRIAYHFCKEVVSVRSSTLLTRSAT